MYIHVYMFCFAFLFFWEGGCMYMFVNMLLGEGVNLLRRVDYC